MISTGVSKRSRVRLRIALLMWAAIAINYIDRANLSAAAPSMMEDLNLTKGEMGLIMSAFFWSYMIFQIPSGWLADRIGYKISLAFSVLWWSGATALTAAAQGLGSLLGLRVLLGLGEAGAYPSNVGVTARWFPDSERGKVSALFDSGARVGTAVAMPIIVWLISLVGWRASFIVSGSLGIFWAIIWIYYYKDPEKHKYVNNKELNYIKGGQIRQDSLGGKPALKWYQLFRYRNIWAICLGFFCLNYSVYFFITWFPSYLVEERGLTLIDMGFIAMIPPLAGMFAEWFGGWLTDYLYSQKGLSLTLSRKINLIAGMLLATMIAWAGFVSSAAASVFLLSVSFAGLSIAAAAVMSLPGDIAPPNMTATVAGAQNCFSNAGGILGPIITGFLVQMTGSFLSALFFSGFICLLGALIYLFVMKKVEPIKVK